MRQVEDQPVLGDALHPGSGVGQALAQEVDPVAARKAAKAPPGGRFISAVVTEGAFLVALSTLSETFFGKSDIYGTAMICRTVIVNVMTGYDPQLLATFLAVEQTGSFTRAAARLGLQQPTVSQHIRRLRNRSAGPWCCATPTRCR